MILLMVNSGLRRVRSVSQLQKQQALWNTTIVCITLVKCVVLNFCTCIDLLVVLVHEDSHCIMSFICITIRKMCMRSLAILIYKIGLIFFFLHSYLKVFWFSALFGAYRSQRACYDLKPPGDLPKIENAAEHEMVKKLLFLRVSDGLVLKLFCLIIVDCVA